MKFYTNLSENYAAILIMGEPALTPIKSDAGKCNLYFVGGCAFYRPCINWCFNPNMSGFMS